MKSLPHWGNLFSRLAQRSLPDPMVLACSLTLLVIISALIVPQNSELVQVGLGQRASTVVELWFAGIWKPAFLVFALQMCVVLLTGFGLAKAPPVMSLLHYVVSRIRSGRTAVLCVTAVSCAGCWINWGFGLIAAGVLASELRSAFARKKIKCQYALIVAGAYAGMMIWHGGLSGSAPLKMAEKGISTTTEVDFATGDVDPRNSIAISRTILSKGNLLLTAVFILGMPLLLWSIGSSNDQDLELIAPEKDCAVSTSAVKPTCQSPTIAERFNRSRLIPMLIALIGGGVLCKHLAADGLDAIDINFVNTLFLILGLFLHRNLAEYVSAVTEGGRAITGIVLQFPLYSGIQSVMFGTGIAVAISEGFVEGSKWIADALHLSEGTTFPVAAFLSAGLVNLFVPSGGGQWIVQGPIMCGTAVELSLPIEQAVMAVSYGDQWTNMIQPFWAIPLMGLTGVNARHFMGYCALLMLLAAPVFMFGLVVLY